MAISYDLHQQSNCFLLSISNCIHYNLVTYYDLGDKEIYDSSDEKCEIWYKWSACKTLLDGLKKRLFLQPNQMMLYMRNSTLFILTENAMNVY